MSYNKTKLIKERNLFLEKMYILEQSTGSSVTTTTTTQKITPEQETKIKNLPSCPETDSKFNPIFAYKHNNLSVHQVNGKDFCTKKVTKI